jgi:organic radical activating enzyme
MITLAKFDGKLEVFYTIQGEGRNIGLPVIFIRTSFCSLHCSWCDAWYTFNFVGTKFINVQYPKVDRLSHQVKMTADEVFDLVVKTNPECRSIVLTGGEPLLQQKELVPLVRKLSEKGYHIEVETSGTIVQKLDFSMYIDQYNCSPKLENSGNPLKLRIVHEALKQLSTLLWNKTWFKFVIMSEADLDEVLSLTEQYHIQPDRVFLMPEGVNGDILREKAGELVEVCKKYGFRFTPRLQIELYGMKPGT